MGVTGEVKRCSKCGEEKAATTEMFTKNPRGPLGLSGVCLACHALKKTPLPEGQKRCSKCKEVLPIEEFGPHKRTLDRLRSECKACGRSDTVAYRARNPDKTKAQNRKHVEKIQASPGGWPELRRKYSVKRLEYEKIYRRENAARINKANQDRYWADLENARAHARARSKEWRIANPDKARAAAVNSRFRRGELAAALDGGGIRKLFIKCSGRCIYCGERVGGAYKRFHVDHYIPLSKGGPHHIDNLVLACQRCNQRKYNKMPWEFMPEKFSPPAP